MPDTTIALKNIADPRLRTHARAAVQAVDCMQRLAAAGSNVVAEVLAGREYVEFEHYPPDDVYDPKTHALYYFHAHPPGRGKWDDYGHFHLFLRLPDMPNGAMPVPIAPASSVEPDTLCHLVAISMDRFGRPVRLFTTNRWVTNETWYGGADVIAALDRFVIKRARPSRLLNRWLGAMVTLYRPDIERLIIERDEAIAQWRIEHPGTDVFEDRALEITSGLDIDVERTLAGLREALGLG